MLLNNAAEKNELKGQALSSFYDCAVEQGVDLYLGYGVLLGAVREGDFIGWDGSIELFLKFENIDKIDDSFISLLESKGFYFDRDNLDLRSEREKFIFYHYGVRVAVVAWHERGDFRVRRYLKIPSHYFGAGRIAFRGKSYLCMHPPEDYLSFQYDDWQTPTASSNSDDYFSKKCYRYPFFFYIFRKKISRRLGQFIKIQDKLVQNIKP